MTLIDDRLIRHLEEAFPNTLPTKPISIEELRELQGRQKVIDHIKALKESSDEEALLNVHG